MRAATGAAGGGWASIVLMPPMFALLKRPSGTPLKGTAPATSASALTLRRWKSGSGSLIVCPRRPPRTCSSAVRRSKEVSTSTLLQERFAAVKPPLGVDISGQDNSMAPIPDPTMSAMDLDAARAHIRERSELNAFISLSSEAGTGTVVGVKDLVDVAGMVTT